jgi:hypothetical protein
MDFFSICEAKGIGYATYLAQNKAGVPLLVYESEGIEKVRAYARRVVCGRADALMDLAVYLNAKYGIFPGGFRLKQRKYFSQKSPLWRGGVLFFTDPLPSGMKISGNYLEVKHGLIRSFLMIRETANGKWRIWDSTGVNLLTAITKKYRGKIEELDAI